MPLLKPPRGTQLDRTRPLARSIRACWLFNEGSGARVFDLSGNLQTHTLQGTSSWTAGQFGAALYYDGNDDSVETNTPVIGSAPVSVSLWFRADELPSTRAEDGTLLIQRTVGSPYQSFRTLIDDANDKIFLLIYNSSGINTVSIGSDSAIQVGTWYHVVFTLDSGYDAHMYVNGVQQAATGNSGSLYSANGVLRLGSRTGTVDDFKGKIDLVTIFNRSLSASEIALLYREPFCLFERTKSYVRAFALPTPVFLTGSANVQSAASGTLGSFGSSSETKRGWLREALFNGVTSNAFKLGTTLSVGWFWQRTAGCSALFRGSRMDWVDFADILAVVSHDADVISPPVYVRHDGNSTYVYVLRRFNRCGNQEQTLTAAAKVSIDANGDFLKHRPNKVSDLRAEQAGGSRMLLTWFYCPLEQETPPVRFNVYYDNRTGQIDYETPLVTIDYRGRRFYRYHSDALEPGGYTFDVRVEDANGVESSSSGQLVVQISAANPVPIEILNAGCL